MNGSSVLRPVDPIISQGLLPAPRLEKGAGLAEDVGGRGGIALRPRYATRTGRKGMHSPDSFLVIVTVTDHHSRPVT